MNTGANVEALWCDLLDASVIFDQQDDSASALLRAVLQDVELVAIDLKTGEVPRRRHGVGNADRGVPGSVLLDDGLAAQLGRTRAW